MPTFPIQNIQGVLFIENFAFRNKLSIASKINEALNNLFDGDPIMLDLPPMAPLEIPRIQLKDHNSVYSLNFSPIRVDFYYNEPGKPEKTLDLLRDVYLKYLFSIAELIKAEYHLPIPRIAMVLKTLSEMETESSLFIQGKFLGGKPFFRGASQLEIHALEKTTMKDYNVNRWFRIRTGGIAGVGLPVNEKALSVEIDINTIPETNLDFDIEKIKEFYKDSLDFARQNFSDCFGEFL
jgi:hypothetical protein